MVPKVSAIKVLIQSADFICFLWRALKKRDLPEGEIFLKSGKKPSLTHPALKEKKPSLMLLALKE
jgi:hypothetical protein